MRIGQECILDELQIEEIDQTVLNVTGTGDIGVTGIADQVAITVGLVRVGDGRAIIGIVEYLVCIVVGAERCTRLKSQRQSGNVRHVIVSNSMVVNASVSEELSRVAE